MARTRPSGLKEAGGLVLSAADSRSDNDVIFITRIATIARYLTEFGFNPWSKLNVSSALQLLNGRL